MPVSQGCYEENNQQLHRKMFHWMAIVWVRSCQKPKLQTQCSLVLENKHELNSHYRQVLGIEHSEVIITQSCLKELHVYEGDMKETSM